MTPRQMKARARDFEAAMNAAGVHRCTLSPEMIRGGAIAISTLLASKNPRHKTRGLQALHRAQRHNLEIHKLELAYTEGLPVQRHEIRQDNGHLLEALEKASQQDIDAAGKIGREFQTGGEGTRSTRTWDKPTSAKAPSSSSKGKPPPRPKRR